ncbi:MAG: c-type cytochrome [Caulobacteraceae bacterium]
MNVKTLMVLILAAGATACGQQNSSTAGETAAAGPSPAAQQKMLASLPAPYSTGDVVNGKKQFGLCRSCHSAEKDGPNMTGPHLYGVFGRPVAAVEDFAYSDALKSAGGTWTPERLDQWLEHPRTTIPGTKMSFAGLPDAKDRIDLIAFLRTQADS